MVRLSSLATQFSTLSSSLRFVFIAGVGSRRWPQLFPAELLRPQASLGRQHLGRLSRSGRRAANVLVPTGAIAVAGAAFLGFICRPCLYNRGKLHLWLCL